MNTETLNQQQAVTALQELTAQGRITEHDVSEAIATRAAKYQARLDILKYGILTSQSVPVELSAKRSVGRPKGSTRKRKAGRPKKMQSLSFDDIEDAIIAGVAKKKVKKVTPEQVASRIVQGKYLGLLRQIPVSRRKEFQKIAKEKSREASIRAMTVYLKTKKAPKAAKAMKVTAKPKSALKVKAKAVAKKAAPKKAAKVAPKKESTFARAMKPLAAKEALANAKKATRKRVRVRKAKPAAAPVAVAVESNEPQPAKIYPENPDNGQAVTQPENYALGADAMEGTEISVDSSN